MRDDAGHKRRPRSQALPPPRLRGPGARGTFFSRRSPTQSGPLKPSATPRRCAGTEHGAGTRGRVLSRAPRSRRPKKRCPAVLSLAACGSLGARLRSPRRGVRPGGCRKSGHGGCANSSGIARPGLRKGRSGHGRGPATRERLRPARGHSVLYSAHRGRAAAHPYGPDSSTNGSRDVRDDRRTRGDTDHS